MIGGSPPAVDSSASKIQKYIVDHDSGIKLAAILFAISVIFGVAWLGSLWRVISRLEPRGPRLALMAGVGFVISAAAAGVSQAILGGFTTRIDTLGDQSAFVWAVCNALCATPVHP